MNEYQFEDYGVLAEERYHVEECDKEEYGRIFKFTPYRLIIPIILRIVLIMAIPGLHRRLITAFRHS